MTSHVHARATLADGGGKFTNPDDSVLSIWPGIASQDAISASFSGGWALPSLTIHREAQAHPCLVPAAYSACQLQDRHVTAGSDDAKTSDLKAAGNVMQWRINVHAETHDAAFMDLVAGNADRVGDDNSQFAINCTRSAKTSALGSTLTPEASDLLRRSIAPASEKALRGDLAQYQAWGGTLPASPNMICAYIGDHAGKHAAATIQRRIASIAKAHKMAGLSNPCSAEIVKATLRGLRRTQGTAQRQAKPLLKEDLFLVLDTLGESLRDQRDRALLLLGFAGGFRRSELVALECRDIEAVRQGLIVTIRRSKTDQEGAGRRIGIPHGRMKYCPVSAVETWLAATGFNTGPLFRPITRHAHLSDTALTGDAVSVLLRERMTTSGIDPEGYSGHSLRSGFATSAAQAGVSTLKIRAQTGHTTDGMLARYIRNVDMFTGNAAGAVL